MAHAQRSHEVLIEIHHPEVLRWYCRHGARQEAEDLTQEVWERMQRYAGKPEGEWLSLLHEVRNNVFNDYLRALRRLVAVQGLLPDDVALPGDPGVEERVLDRHETRALIKALGRGSKPGFRTFMGHAVLDEPIEAIAAREGVSPETVRKRVTRMRKVARALGRGRGLLPAFAPPLLTRMALRRSAGVVIAAAGGTVGLAVLGPAHPATVLTPPVAVSWLGPPAIVAPTDAGSATPIPARVPASMSPPASVSRRAHAAPATAPSFSPTVEPVAGAHVGDHSTVSGGFEIERDHDPRSPLAQLADCIARGPSLDPENAGCP